MEWSGDVYFVCTDSGARSLDEECGKRFPVEKISYADALDKYKPNVVLVSWMELGQDWTEAFRACPSVDEYILIGEADSGVCGRLRETWGAPAHRAPQRPPAYMRQGFARTELELPQVGRTDDPWSRRSRSSTVVFRRVRPAPPADPARPSGAPGDGGRPVAAVGPGHPGPPLL